VPEVLPAGLPVAGELAESPDVVVAPLLAFCESAIEPLNSSATVAVISVIFTLYPPSSTFRHWIPMRSDGGGSGLAMLVTFASLS
jgi:hypothetical protein